MVASYHFSRTTVFVAFLFALCCSLSISQASAVSLPQRHTNAYAAVYSHDTPDHEERLLATRVMIRSLQVTRPKADVVIMVSASTPDDIRDIFTGYGCIVIEIRDKASYFNTAPAASSGTGFGASPVMLQLAAAAQGPSSPAAAASSSSLEAARAFQSPLRSSVYARKCPANRDFMYLWTLTQYHRVVYVEADTLVFRNLDDLFKCGHFCMVYANENCWNSGFLVLKPSIDEFRRFFIHYAQKSELIEQRSQNSFFAPSLSCVNEYHDSILVMFPGIEAAPLFYARDGISDLPMQRVNLIYGVNAIFFYEHFTWILYRLNLPLKTHGGSYNSALYRTVDEKTISIALNPNATDNYQWGIPNDVPAFSMSFFEPHPYSWWEASFFDLNWWWHQSRALLVPETNADIYYVLVSRLAALLLSYYVGEKLMARYFTPRFREQSVQTWERVYAYFVLHTGTAGSVEGMPDKALKDLPTPTSEEVSLSAGGFRLPITPRFRAAIRGTFVGCLAIVLAAVVVKPMIPPHTAPNAAWPLFCLWQNLVLYWIIKIVYNLCPVSEIAFQDPQIGSMLSPFLMEIITLVHNKSDLHNHFVKKIIVFVVCIAITWLLQTAWFRKLAVTRYELAHGLYVPKSEVKAKHEGDAAYEKQLI